MTAIAEAAVTRLEQRIAAIRRVDARIECILTELQVSTLRGSCYETFPARISAVFKLGDWVGRVIAEEGGPITFWVDGEEDDILRAESPDTVIEFFRHRRGDDHIQHG